MSVGSNRPELSPGQALSSASEPSVLAIDQPPTFANRISNDLLGALLVELRILNFQFADAFGTKADVVAIRDDPTFRL